LFFPEANVEDLYYIYMLKSEKNTLYTGITTDLYRRLREHLAEKKGGAKYTRAFRARDLELVFVTGGRSAASKIEYRIKALSREEKELLIQNQEAFREKFEEELKLKIWALQDIEAVRDFLKILNEKRKKG
jgi:putative endonuclease